jgi:protein-S-isoprenylcysteine O-methyltransferase Ste14
MDNLLHIIFVISILSFIFIRVAFHLKAKSVRREVELKESKLNMAVRAILGLGYVGTLVVYAFAPSLFSWAAFRLPTWIQWIGVLITLGSVLLIWWVQWALDVQFDTTLHTQADHQLITHGPYHWVRHPMYSALFLLGLGWLLLTANWLIGTPLMIGIIGVVFMRIDNEEAVLIDLFGEEYRDYMKHTGRFLPILFSRS